MRKCLIFLCLAWSGTNGSILLSITDNDELFEYWDDIDWQM